MELFDMTYDMGHGKMPTKEELEDDMAIVWRQLIHLINKTAEIGAITALLGYTSTETENA
jgi:predicted RNA polymerase sigma factor